MNVKLSDVVSPPSWLYVTVPSPFTSTRPCAGPETTWIEVRSSALSTSIAGLRIYVNISSLSFDRGLVDSVATALARHGLPAEALGLELTESAVFEDTASATETMRMLRQIGVGVSLDDFGTGYSSLSRIALLPISGIKIDRAFVSQIGGSGSAVIAALISLARHLRVEIVAEGVETEEQEAFLRAEGCDLLQGFRYSHPIAAAELTALLDRDAPLA